MRRDDLYLGDILEAVDYFAEFLQGADRGAPSRADPRALRIGLGGGVLLRAAAAAGEEEAGPGRVHGADLIVDQGIIKAEAADGVLIKVGID